MKSDIKVINSTTFKDKRGYYWTTWKKGTLKKINFNHDKFSMSKRNILRGFHCDFKSWKLLTCVYGELLLVVLNVDNKKKSYLKYKKFILNYKKPKLILIPPNYANAYLCLSKECVLHYKWSYRGKYIDSKKQSSFRWNDPKFKIKWPIKKPILSNRDKNSKFL